jgi:hypothetical protein
MIPLTAWRVPSLTLPRFILTLAGALAGCPVTPEATI